MLRALVFTLALIHSMAFQLLRSPAWRRCLLSLSTKSPINQEFMNNFQGTRVFVENIPPNTDWREFKDFFKRMGLKVVYASISKDSDGKQKNYGIAQFESVADREKCMELVKEYKLRGNTLSVREDRQEKRGEGERSLQPRAPPVSRPFRIRKWKLAEGYSIADVVSWGFDIKTIVELLERREKQRGLRNFEYADELRKELRLSHGVQCDDDKRTWKPLVNFKARSPPNSESDLDEIFKEF